MSKYLELPWSVEDTIENLKELKDGLQEKCIIQNLHGRGEKDAEEIAFDFDRAINALEEIQKYRAIGTPDECRAAVEKQRAKKPIRNDKCTCPSCGTHNEIIRKRRNTVYSDIVYCWHCGQALKIYRSDEEC